VTKETNCDQSTESGGRDSGPRRSYLISVRKNVAFVYCKPYDSLASCVFTTVQFCLSLDLVENCIASVFVIQEVHGVLLERNETTPPEHSEALNATVHCSMYFPSLNS